MKRFLAVAAVALGALCAGPAVALAHPQLLQAAPAPGLIAPRSPARVSLALSEAVVPRGSRIQLIAGRRPVALGKLTTADGAKTLSAAPAGPLRSAVYTVRWSALGDDGHTVSGSFAFGVAGAHGAPPPGAERLGGPGAGSRGGASAAADGGFSIAARWIGILAASVLFGGFALGALLRRRGVTDRDGTAPLRALAPLCWLLLVVAASEGVIASATAGAGGRLDLGLLTASPEGRTELARAAVLLATTIAARVFRRRADAAYAAGAGAALVTYAIAGHALVAPTVWELAAQSVHVLSAGLWVGGVIALALLVRGRSVPLAEGARTFAPVAAGALALAGLTGLLAAVRDVHGWYFLRWSSYGNVVIAKTLVVVLVVALAGLAAWRRRLVLLGAEACGLILVLLVAATLSGLPEGRGQLLPAQRGDLLPGPAVATVLVPPVTAHLVLAPARAGVNTASVTFTAGERAPRTVSLRFAAPGRPGVRVSLRRGAGGTWSAPVSLPGDGAWYGYVTVDGTPASAPVELTVGVPRARGSTPVEVLTVADLSGAGAARCASHVLGLELAIARVNATGGLDGGHKLAPLVLDDGGNAARSAAVARAAIAQERPIALAAPCGDGAAGAVRAAAAAGVPSIVGDPAVAPVAARGVFRLAADPYAQGVALGQYVTQRIVAAARPGHAPLRAIVAPDAPGQRLLAGLRFALHGQRVVLMAPGSLARLSMRGIAALLRHTRSLALLLDEPAAGGGDAAALARYGRVAGNSTQVPVIASERVLSERLITGAGALGRIGALQGVTEVSPATRDAQEYGIAVQTLYAGERPTLDGLRGYVTGLALIDALAGGTSPGTIDARLLRPAVFTNALLAPWSPHAPGLGSPALLVVAPQFLSSTLVPPSQGGEPYDGTYFPDGDWITATTTPVGPGVQSRPPPLR